MTPDLGLGGTCAVESAVVLCNLLQNKLCHSSSNDEQTLSQDDITQLFHQYQNRQWSRARRLCTLSGRATRLHSWATLTDQFITRILIPINAVPLAAIMAKVVRKGELLDYAAIHSVRKGNQNWTRQVDVEGWPVPFTGEDQGKRGSRLSPLLLLLFFNIGIVLYFWKLLV